MPILVVAAFSPQDLLEDLWQMNSRPAHTVSTTLG